MWWSSSVEGLFSTWPTPSSFQGPRSRIIDKDPIEVESTSNKCKNKEFGLFQIAGPKN